MIDKKREGFVVSRSMLALVVILAGLVLLVVAASSDSTEQVLGTSLLALIPAAFLSGVLSFLSPCSLPILPAYFAYSFQSSKKNIVVMTLAFLPGWPPR